MKMDELEPTGYFSEFSWHSYEEDGPPDTVVAATEPPQRVAGADDVDIDVESRDRDEDENEVTYLTIRSRKNRGE